MSHQVTLNQIQHKINIDRYKKERAPKDINTTRTQKINNWNKQNVEFDKELAERQPMTRRE